MEDPLKPVQIVANKLLLNKIFDLFKGTSNNLKTMIKHWTLFHLLILIDDNSIRI